MGYTRMMLLLAILILNVLPLRSEVFVSPSEITTTRGGNATILCIPTADERVVAIYWFIDENRIQMNDSFIIREESDHGNLTISNVPAYLNNNSIACSITFTSESTHSRNAALLLVQDLLAAVGSLSIVRSADTTVSLTWTAPFTLDIPNVDPDIVYCVYVHVSNSTSITTVHSECTIIETEVSYPVPDADCHVYTFTIIPINIVGMGQSANTTYVGAEMIEVLNLVRLSSESSDGTAEFTYLLNLTAPVCSGELISFVDIDAEDSEETMTTEDIDLIITGNTITFTAEVVVNRHYNITVAAGNSAGIIALNASLSSHDIMNATVEKVTNDEVNVVTSYFEHSDATGALFFFICIIDSVQVDLERSLFMAFDRITSHNHTFPFNLPAGQYGVFVYDIERTGTLFNGVSYPADNDILMIESNGQDSPTTPVKQCNIVTSLHLISVECGYADMANFQMIVQLGVLEEVHKLYVNRTMDGHTSASVEVEESGLYLVSIIPITEGTGIADSAVEYREMVMVDDEPEPVPGAVQVGLIIGLIIGVLFLISASVGIYALWLRQKYMRRRLLRKLIVAPISVSMRNSEWYIGNKVARNSAASIGDVYSFGPKKSAEPGHSQFEYNVKI